MADKKKPRVYTWLDFLVALQRLPDDLSSVALGDFMLAKALSRDTQPVYTRWIARSTEFPEPTPPA